MDDELEEAIKSQVEEWSTNSNECFRLNFVNGDGAQVTTCTPLFTYEIFGEEEAIFGYQDLEIKLSFAEHNLTPHLSVKYGAKFPDKGEVKPTDVVEALRDFLPDIAFSSDAEAALVDPHASEFRPPGELVHDYTRGDERFQVWCASLSDPSARKILENMQILMPMFIEGGSALQLEHEWTTQRWKLFILYSVSPAADLPPTHSAYSFVGYGTSYRIFTFPDRNEPLQSDIELFTPSSQSLYDFLPPPETPISNDLAPTTNPNGIKSPLDLPSRERLSQFLILPEYQKEGHGQEMYKAMYNTLSKPANVREFTVEDPNEAFDDLRDLCDLLHLRANDTEFASLRVVTEIPTKRLASEDDVPTDLIVPLATRNSIRSRSKIMQRQFDRLVEIHTLSHIPAPHRNRNRVTRREKTTNPQDRAYYFWRLYVKQRLYVFNRDQLAQLERPERIEKLEGALESVQEAYVEMIEKVEKREKARMNGNGAEVDGSPMAVEGAGEGGKSRVKGKKRKVVIEDEDDEDMEDEEPMLTTNGSKKMRVG